MTDPVRYSDYLPLPLVRYTDLEFDTVLESLEAIVKYHDQVPGTAQFWSDFFESNVGYVLMKHVAYSSELASFCANQIAREIFLETCERYDSALRHAALLGYRPGMPAAAQMPMRVLNNPLPNATSGTITVIRGTRVTVLERTWEVLENKSYSWTPSDPYDESETQIEVIDAITITDSFTAYSGPSSDDEAKRQYFDSSEFPVIGGSWTLKVNNIEWSEVDALIYTGQTNSYTITLTGFGGLRFHFGDGINGNIPAPGANIEAVYRIGGGTSGNITGESVVSRIDTFVNGSAVKLRYYNTDSSGGGYDRETVDSIKRAAPRWHLTTNRAITQSDYEAILSNLASEEQLPRTSRTFSKLRHDDGTYLGTEQLYVDTYVWAFDGDGNIDVMTDANALLLEERLNEGDICAMVVHNSVIPGDMKSVPIVLGNVTILKEVETKQAEIESQIEENINDYFQSLTPGEYVRRVRIEKAVTDINGVAYFTMTEPSGDVSVENTEIAKMGSLSFTLIVEEGF